MTAYPVTLPDPLLSSGITQSAQNFKRTKFDYKSRQRQTLPKDLIINAAFVLDQPELTAFNSFYNTVLNDDLKISCDWRIHANDWTGKTLLLLSTPTLKHLGRFKYNVSLTFKVVAWGLSNEAVLYPSDILTPNDLLYPT